MLAWNKHPLQAAKEDRQMHFTFVHLCNISPGWWHGVALQVALMLSQLCISLLSPQMSKHLAGWVFYQDGRCKIATPVKAGFFKHAISEKCWYAPCGMFKRTEIANAFYFTGLGGCHFPHTVLMLLPPSRQSIAAFPCSPKWAGQAGSHPTTLLP